MAITLQQHQPQQITHITVSGILTLKDIAGVIAEFYDSQPTLNVLCDLSKVTGTDLTFDHVQSIAKQVRAQRTGREGGKSAFVSPGDTTFGLGRMLEMLLEDDPGGSDVSIMIFRELDAALQWLDRSSQ